jgi:hypothetical protein
MWQSMTLKLSWAGRHDRAILFGARGYKQQMMSLGPQHSRRQNIYHLKYRVLRIKAVQLELMLVEQLVRESLSKEYFPESIKFFSIKDHGSGLPLLLIELRLSHRIIFSQDRVSCLMDND